MTESPAPVLSEELRREADAIVAKYPHARSAALPLLFLVQSAEGYLSEAGMREVAEILGLTPAEVLGTASFYSMLKRRPQGDYLLSVCRNVSCTHLGSRAVIRALEERLGIVAGEVTPDGRFALEAAECLATCDGAPAMQVNYEDFYALSPEDAVSVVDRLERGDEVRSVRGERVRTFREIARETAIAGVRRRPAGDEGQARGEAGSDGARLTGGEAPPPDMLPGSGPPGESPPRPDGTDEPAAGAHAPEVQDEPAPNPRAEPRSAGDAAEGDPGEGGRD
ncbi:MAG: NAD(P)H-dependent oxidoreductase subunit E [Actinomycetota bacterium]